MLIAYRALDTMLEKVVLVLALIGVWSLAADRHLGRHRRPAARDRSAEGALAFLAQLLPPVGIVVAIYIVWVGAEQPGGAFQGGDDPGRHVAARHDGAALPKRPRSAARWLRLALVAGPAVFLASAWRALPSPAPSSPIPPATPSR